jgi:hypothetical protein
VQRWKKEKGTQGSLMLLYCSVHRQSSARLFAFIISSQQSKWRRLTMIGYTTSGQPWGFLGAAAAVVME